MKRARRLTHSIRFGVALAIALMGLFSLAVALLTGERYKWLVAQNDQRALSELLGYEVHAELGQNYRRQLLLAQKLQKRSDFRDAVRRGDAEALGAILDDQFRQYLVTTGKLALRQLRVFDTAFQPLAASSRGPLPYRDRPACQDAVDRAAARDGLDRLKKLDMICPHDKQLLASTTLPVGGIRPFAYLMVVASPVPSLLEISEELQSPLQVQLPSGRVAGQAGDWHDDAPLRGAATAEYTLRGPEDEALFHVRVIRDASHLAARLAATRVTMTITTVALTGLAMLLAFLVLRRTLIKPLAEVTSQVQRITADRNHLGERVPLAGGGEIRQLAASFNEMSAELQRLYRELEHMAFSDPLTRLPNRAWFYDSLHRLASLTERGAPGFALLFLDLDRFKAINDTLGHKVGDEVLKLLAARVIGVLRGGDYLARFREEASDALARMGGDEFAILLPSVQDVAAAERVAQKIIAAVQRPMHIGEHQLDLGTSIGIALYPADAGDTDTLVHRADLAMYHAKTRGSGYAHYQPTMSSASTGT